MELTVNGDAKQVDTGTTLADLLGMLGMDRAARGIAVAVNDAVIPQPSWHKKTLSDGDKIEIIHAVQGG
jgi:sulfur carrier protein